MLARRSLFWEQGSWIRFLNTYGLKQGLHAGLRHRCGEVFNSLVPIFKPPLRAGHVAEQLTDRWATGVVNIGNLIHKKKADGTSPQLWSMASKILWFYHPLEMTMFDRYAAKALSQRLGRKITPQCYLSRFEELYGIEEPMISATARFSDRIYPYSRRVLDQWLWLKGSGDEYLYIRQFKQSLMLAPIR